MSAPNPEVRKRVVAPRFGGRLPGAYAIRWQGMGQADVCADVTKLELGCDEAGTIVAARHLTYGCPPAIAAAEWLCERLEGSDLNTARNLTVNAVSFALGLPASDDHASQTVIDALRDALESST
jgi:NifU-like protein involved in Fe-S cluster formation